MSKPLDGKRILILGAGTWQVPYLRKAKALGLKVYATDWSSDAFGKNFADFFEPIDLKDKERTLQFAIENKIEAVLTASEIGVLAAAYVANKLNLPYHSIDLALMATNKYLMRKKAKEIGLSIPKYEIAREINDAIVKASNIEFPLIIKPVDNCASRGVFYLSSIEDLKKHFNESIKASNRGEVLLEEYMTGQEGSVEVLVSDGVEVILGISSKIKSDLPYRYDLKLNYPGSYSEKQFVLIKDFVKKLIAGYGVQNGILHIEIIVNKDSVRLIEFALRGCGTRVVTDLLPSMLGFDIVEYLIMQSLGENKEVKLRKNLCGILQFIILNKGKIREIKGMAEARKVHGIVDLDIEKKPGDVVEEIKDGRARPGYVLAVGENFQTIEDCINQTLKKITVTYEQ